MDLSSLTQKLLFLISTVAASLYMLRPPLRKYKIILYFMILIRESI